MFLLFCFVFCKIAFILRNSISCTLNNWWTNTPKYLPCCRLLLKPMYHLVNVLLKILPNKGKYDLGNYDVSATVQLPQMYISFGWICKSFLSFLTSQIFRSAGNITQQIKKCGLEYYIVQISKFAGY